MGCTQHADPVRLAQPVNHSLSVYFAAWKYRVQSDVGRWFARPPAAPACHPPVHLPSHPPTPHPHPSIRPSG